MIYVLMIVVQVARLVYKPLINLPEVTNEQLFLRQSQAITAVSTSKIRTAMAEQVTDMVKVFDGTNGDVSNWIKKVKLVAKLKKVTELASFLPLYLDGDAFEVFDQMNEEDKADAKKIETALLKAFAQSSFNAYKAFRQRSWIVGETVDVYISNLHRLAKLAHIESDALILRAFVVGFPADVCSQLESIINIDHMALVEVVERARILVANRNGEYGMAAAKMSTQRRPKSRSFTCFQCGQEGHIARRCPNRFQLMADSKQMASGIVCYTCGMRGHMSRECVSGTVKESGKPRAPVASQED